MLTITKEITNRHDILLIILAFIDNTKYAALCNWLNLIGLVYIKIVIDLMHTTINHPSEAMPTHMERTCVPRSIL